MSNLRTYYFTSTDHRAVCQSRRWRTLVYTFPKHELCYTSERMLKGPDATQIDFAIWKITEKRFQKRKGSTLWQALNEHFREQRRKLEHFIINNTLET